MSQEIKFDKDRLLALWSDVSAMRKIADNANEKYNHSVPVVIGNKALKTGFLANPGDAIDQLFVAELNTIETFLSENEIVSEECLQRIENITMTEYLEYYTKSKGVSSVKGNPQISNHCTTIANIVIINRLLKMKGLYPDLKYTYENAREDQNKKSPYDISNLVYKVRESELKYKVKRASKKDKAKFENNVDYVVDLLNKHPEGIQFYGHYQGGVHAVTISRYEIVGSEIKFYAYDSNGKNRNEMELSQTSLFTRQDKTKVKTPEDMINKKMINVMYVEEVT